MDNSRRTSIYEQVEKQKLSLWDLNAPKSFQSAVAAKFEGLNSVPSNQGPPRVLEIGCGSGSWCFNFKKERPDWILEGIDDTNHWLCVHTDATTGYVSMENSFALSSFSSHCPSNSNPFLNLPITLAACFNPDLTISQ